MMYFSIKGEILWEYSTEIEIPQIGSIIKFDNIYHLVVSHLHSPIAGFSGIIIDPLDPFLDGRLADFQISNWAYKIFKDKLCAMEEYYKSFQKIK